jgi:hypothetical protein
MRYIAPQQLMTNLHLGKPIEQWLGYNIKQLPQGKYTVLKWLTIYKETNSAEYSVNYMEVFDEGSENFLDIYQFNTIDTDEPYGIMTRFKTAKEALDYSIGKYNCEINKFVNDGVIQEEYKDYIMTRL